MRTGSAQLDDPTQANSADERGGRNIKPTDIRLKVIFDDYFIAVRYQGLFCGEERSLKQIPPPQGQVVASGRAVLVFDDSMDAYDKCIGSELDLTDVIEDNIVFILFYPIKNNFRVAM